MTRLLIKIDVERQYCEWLAGYIMGILQQSKMKTSVAWEIEKEKEIHI